MAFTLPTFNLAVNIWRVNGVGGNYAAPDLQVSGNLTPGRRTFQSFATAPSITTYSFTMELLLPKLTDVRATWNGISADLIECPAGSHRFYGVLFVDDIGKGFTNEHRLVMMIYNRFGVNPSGGVGFNIPAPVPLP